MWNSNAHVLEVLQIFYIFLLNVKAFFIRRKASCWNKAKQMDTGNIPSSALFGFGVINRHSPASLVVDY